MKLPLCRYGQCFYMYFIRCLSLLLDVQMSHYFEISNKPSKQNTYIFPPFIAIPLYWYIAYEDEVHCPQYTCIEVYRAFTQLASHHLFRYSAARYLFYNLLMTPTDILNFE